MLDLTRSIKRFSVHQRRRGKSKSRNFNRWVGDEWSTNSGSRTPFVWPFGEIGARPGIFNWGQDRSAENRDRRPRAGLGSWGGGTKPTFHQLGNLGAQRSSPAGFWWSPDLRKVFHHFQHSGWPLLSHDYNIVNCGLSCSHWGARPPPLRAPLWRVVSDLCSCQTGRLDDGSGCTMGLGHDVSVYILFSVSCMVANCWYAT